MQGSWKSHSALKIRKKLNRPKNPKNLLDFKRDENIGQTPAPKIGETDRQIQGVMAYWSRDPQGETSVGTRAGRTSAKEENLNCN